MITLTDPEERISALEDAVFNDLYPRVDAMNWGIGQVYQETQANREEIAGLRVDIAALETSVHADLAALKANVTMQVNGLRREIATTRSALRSEMTMFKSAVDRRFDAMDRRFDAMDNRFDAMDSRFGELAGKLDEFMREMRGGRA
jgi:chromosome segregation ATPase